METIVDIDYNSNSLFFLTNFSGTLKAGKNSLIINPTDRIYPNSNFELNVYDINGNELPTGVLKPTNSKYQEQTSAGNFYYINVNSDTPPGIGRIEIRAKGLYLFDYTGSIAFYKNIAYKVEKNQKLPLTQAVSGGFIPPANIIWTRNVLIDSSSPTDSEIRFFDRPSISVTSQIYPASIYPTGSYTLSSGSFSAIALNPKNNYDGDYEYQFDSPMYQVYSNSGNKFSSSMEGETIRLKNPNVKRFTYSNFLNNQINFQGTLNTDFICKIKKVINESTLLLEIPFETVSDLIGKTNKDSVYTKNNLVDIKGYTVIDDPDKQTVYHKKNFYILSVDSGDYEVFHNSVPIEVPITSSNKVLLNVEVEKIRPLCGHLSRYKLYYKSLNSPESSTLLCEGKIEPDEHIISNNFNNGLYNHVGKFYNQSYLSKYWKIFGSCTFSHDNSVIIDGARIGHSGNSSQTDYVILKDNTSVSDATYYSYNLQSDSHWYTNKNVFLNYSQYPTSSYVGANGVLGVGSFLSSQENLISGSIHDSNPIKLREKTLYKFSMTVRSSGDNTNSSKMYVYFVSGEEKIQIGYIDSAFNFGANQDYTYTFFSDISKYGTIMFVPVLGNWHISSVSIMPYHAVDYSLDSFAVKIPINRPLSNELYEIEMELYDSQNRLAYGKNSYTFYYNKTFSPLKTKVFVDPKGVTK